MILRLRIPPKLFLCALSATSAAVAGVVWTFHEGTSIPSDLPTFAVTVAKNGEHNHAKSTVGGGSSIGRGTAREKSGRGDTYVSQMLTMAAGNKLPFRLEDRNLGFGTYGLDGFINDVQKQEKLASVKEVSVNLGHLVVAAGGKIAAFAEDPTIFQGAKPPNGDDEPVHNIHPSSSVPPIVPPSSSVPPRSPVPTHSSVPPSPASVPDSGSTFFLMLCCGAGLLIMGTLGSRQLEK
jgi:hypothetical protein